MKPIISISVMATCFFLATACKKGPEGPQGTQGVQGESGLQGIKGDPGNANVKSKEIAAADITWVAKTMYGTNYKIAEIGIPQITDAIVSNGVVMVYGAFLFNTQWTALPTSYYENGIMRLYQFGISTGKVTLMYHLSSNVTPANTNINYKVVIIEGSALAVARQRGINLENYNSVSSYFNLK